MDNREILRERIKFVLDLLKEERKEQKIIGRKEKNKEKILEFLKQNKFATLEDIAKLLNISINRASEYLNELFKEQKVTYIRKNKKKYFKLLNG